MYAVIEKNMLHISVAKFYSMDWYCKERDVMVAYNFEGGDVKLLTIHPLKEGQKENRIKSGRWRKL
jgi:hypothetical protein